MGQLTEFGQNIGAFISSITPGAFFIILVILIAGFIFASIGTAGVIVTKIFGGKK